MTVALISHPDCLRHDMGVLHPESPARLGAISDQLIASGLDALLGHYMAPMATREQLERVHDPAYVDFIFQSAPRRGLTALDPDTLMNPDTLSAALHAAGAPLHAVDLVMRGEVTAAFCNVRPPGHHAERKRAMGFFFSIMSRSAPRMRWRRTASSGLPFWISMCTTATVPRIFLVPTHACCFALHFSIHFIRTAVRRRRGKTSSMRP